MGLVNRAYLPDLPNDSFRSLTSLSSTSESVFFAKVSNNKIMTFSIMPEFPNILKAILFTTPAIINGILSPYINNYLFVKFFYFFFFFFFFLGGRPT